MQGRSPGLNVQFFLLLVVTGILFVRPTDLVPELESAQLYLLSIVICLATSFHVIPPQLSTDSLRRRPITVCVLALLVTNLLSCLANARLDLFLTQTFEFAKVVLFYLLLVGLVDSPRRLRLYLLSMAGVLVVPVGLAVLHYCEYIHLVGFLEIDPTTGQRVPVTHGRLTGTGQFGDPNDFCLLINVGIMLSLYAVLSTRGILRRVVWIGPLALFVLALRLTGSRGGFVAALGSIAVLLVARFGIRKGAILATIALPVIFTQVGGRQTELDVSDRESTGQLRMQFWSQAMEVLKSSPVFGVGPNQTLEHIGGRAVHNSFVQTYSDLGFVGGTLFVGVFYHAFRRLFRRQRRSSIETDPELRFMRPFIMAAMTGYVVTAMSTNHSYNVGTYAILGIAAVYIHLADADRPPPEESMDARMVQRLLLVGIVFVTITIVYIKALVRF